MMGKAALARQRAIDIIGAKRLAALEERGLVVMDFIEQQRWRHERAVLAAENARLREELREAQMGEAAAQTIREMAVGRSEL